MSLGANPPAPNDPPLHVALLCTPHTLPLARHALDRLLCSTGGLRAGEEGEERSTEQPSGLRGTLYLYVPEAGVFRMGEAQAYGSSALDVLTAMANGCALCRHDAPQWLVVHVFVCNSTYSQTRTAIITASPGSQQQAPPLPPTSPPSPPSSSLTARTCCCPWCTQGTWAMQGPCKGPWTRSPRRCRPAPCRALCRRARCWTRCGRPGCRWCPVPGWWLGTRRGWRRSWQPGGRWTKSTRGWWCSATRRGASVCAPW